MSQQGIPPCGELQLLSRRCPGKGCVAMKIGQTSHNYQQVLIRTPPCCAGELDAAGACMPVPEQVASLWNAPIALLCTLGLPAICHYRCVASEALHACFSSAAFLICEP